MATDEEIEAAARAMKPAAFATYALGYTSQNYFAERAFLNAEKNVKRARKDARMALAAAEIVRKRHAEMADDQQDMQGCEHCHKEFPIEDMTMMGDYWFCGGCYTDWEKSFDACEHHWEPEESEFGEPGKYCDKCCGFVLDPQE